MVLKWRAVLVDYLRAAGPGRVRNPNSCGDSICDWCVCKGKIYYWFSVAVTFVAAPLSPFLLFYENQLQLLCRRKIAVKLTATVKCESIPYRGNRRKSYFCLSGVPSLCTRRGMLNIETTFAAHGIQSHIKCIMVSQERKACDVARAVLSCLGARA